MRCFRFLLVVAAMGIAAATPAMAQISTLRITEAMSSSGTSGTPTPDWWEITNFGTSAVNISGWRMDDSTFAFANSVALNGVTSVGVGESVLFIESSTPETAIANFRTFWGGSANVAAIGSYFGSGVSLSSGGDGIVLFNSVGTEVTPRVSFGAATTGSSFYYEYDAIGDPTTSPNTNAVVSTVGTLNGQVTYLSASVTPQNIGSPGTAINAVPEPSSLALIACGASVAAWIAKRRQNG
jgi:hypothetical protein